MSDLLFKLRVASVVSCSCLTKTPDIRYHSESCLYRLLTEASDAIKQLREDINTEHGDLIAKEQILDELIEEFTPSPREWSAQEWWDIAPWQPMDSAPIEKIILIKRLNGAVLRAEYQLGRWSVTSPIDGSVVGISQAVAWLPLPEIKR